MLALFNKGQESELSSLTADECSDGTAASAQRTLPRKEQVLGSVSMVAAAISAVLVHALAYLRYLPAKDDSLGLGVDREPLTTTNKSQPETCGTDWTQKTVWLGI